MTSMFPHKLHEMLEYAEKHDMDHVVSWLSTGRGFKVHRQDKFMKELVPKFFKQNKWKSFQRQLHLYGFERVVKGPIKGAYIHKKFIKNDRYSCHGINRVALKGQAAALMGASASTNRNNISPPSTPKLAPTPTKEEVIVTPTIPDKELLMASSAELRAATALAFLSSASPQNNLRLY